MIRRHRSYKTDGDNTTKRYSKAAQDRFSNSRLVLIGFPYTEKFQTTEELHQYFQGDKLQCLLCGKPYKSLATHLKRVHGMSGDQYREQYGIPWCRGLTCEVTQNNNQNKAKHRMNSGNFIPGMSHKTAEEKNKLWRTKRRPRCPAHIKEQIIRGTATLGIYNKLHPAKIKENI